MTNLDRKRIGLYSAAVMLAAVLGFAYGARSAGIFACQAPDRDADEFLGICNVQNYGDYDHGAFWFGLETDTEAAVKRANVLFVGNSRMQFGLSSPAVNDWFSAYQLKYYLLGFSHDENHEFLRPLLQKIKPTAEMYVINVDKFFENKLTGPANSVMNESQSLNRYKQKRYWQKAHAIVCHMSNALCGNESSYIRNRANGAWRFKGAKLLARAQLIDRQVSNNLSVHAETVVEYEGRARDFLATIPADPQCIVLTNVPNSDMSLGTARALAERLSLSFVAPELEGLATFDGSHLDPASAARWSAAFMEELAPRAAQCLKGATG